MPNSIVLLDTIKQIKENQDDIERYIFTAKKATKANATIFQMVLKLESLYKYLKKKGFEAMDIMDECRKEDNQAKLKKDFPDLFKTPKPKPKKLKVKKPTPQASQGAKPPPSGKPRMNIPGDTSGEPEMDIPGSRN